MTTPRDDIAGLSERLRFDAARCELHFSKGVASNIEEAATQLESLLKERDALQAERDELRMDFDHAMQEFQIRNDELKAAESRADALQARVKLLEGRIEEIGVVVGHSINMSWPVIHSVENLRNRATRLQQERDEAYERLKPFTEYTVKAITVSEEFDYCVHVCCSTDEQPQFKHFREARDLVRRLAGPEKEKKE